MKTGLNAVALRAVPAISTHISAIGHAIKGVFLRAFVEDRKTLMRALEHGRCAPDIVREPWHMCLDTRPRPRDARPRPRIPDPPHRYSGVSCVSPVASRAVGYRPTIR